MVGVVGSGGRLVEGEIVMHLLCCLVSWLGFYRCLGWVV